MQAYAIYRLPHEDHATIIRQKAGDPVELQSLSDLNGRCGFVVAPFEVNGDQPVVLIEGEKEIVPISHHERSRENSWTSQAAEPSAPRASLGRDDRKGCRRRGARGSAMGCAPSPPQSALQVDRTSLRRGLLQNRCGRSGRLANVVPLGYHPFVG